MWTCPKCGEEIENEFNSCAKCAAQAVTDTQTPERWPSWRVAVVWGILIEVGMAGLVIVLPWKSWLFAKVTEKSMPSRFIADHPFLFLIRDHGSGTILFLGRLADPRP